MQIQVIASDANNILCQVTPPAVQTITIDRGVAGNGIVSIVPVTISTFQYLRITYTDGTVSDVGPLTSTAYTATAPINIVGNTISLLTVPIATGGTGATTAAAAIENLLPSYTGNGNKRLGLNSGATALEWVADGGGTVTSVDFSGGTTGLTATGGPITTFGTFTLAGTLGIANGGSGATTAQAAMNAFAGAVTAGSYLRGNGTNVLMSGIQAADVPTLNQNTTGTAANVTGIVAIANGGTGQTTANAAFNALVPAQTGNSGKYLTTDGTNTSWATNPLGTVTSVSGAGTVSGLTLTGTVTTSGSLTLGGTLDLSAYNGAGAFTTLSASGAVTLSGGTANGVAYLNGSKVLTSGSALTFDGTKVVTNALGFNYYTGSYTVDGTISNYSAGNSLYVNGNAGGYLVLQGAGNQKQQIGISGSNTGGEIFFTSNGSESMRLTSTGLGIGTSSPAAKLDVKGDFSLQATNSTNKWYLYTFTDNTLRWNYNGAGGDELVMDSSGNLGLGVTPSAWASYFSAVQAGNASKGGAFVSAGGFSVYGSNYYEDVSGVSRYVNSTYALKYATLGNGTHVWFTAPSGTAGNAISFTQAATLDANGNFLVGTTSLGTSYGATSGVVKQTGGVWTDRGQFSATGGSTTTFLTLANASNNQSYIVSVRQSGNGANFVSAFVIAYAGSCSAIRFAQDNTNPVLDMNITVSGLGLRLVLASGFGNTTWDWVITRLG